MARWIGASGGGWPRPGVVASGALPIAATALVFHSRTMSRGSPAAAVVAGIRMLAAISAIAIGMDSQRLTFERRLGGVMTVFPRIGASLGWRCAPGGRDPAQDLYR